MNTRRGAATPDDTLAKIDKALQHVYDICQGREKWTMRVPADVERDSDLILCEALESARKALAVRSESATTVQVDLGALEELSLMAAISTADPTIDELERILDAIGDRVEELIAGRQSPPSATVTPDHKAEAVAQICALQKTPHDQRLALPSYEEGWNACLREVVKIIDRATGKA